MVLVRLEGLGGDSLGPPWSQMFSAQPLSLAQTIRREAKTPLGSGKVGLASTGSDGPGPTS